MSPKEIGFRGVLSFCLFPFLVTCSSLFPVGRLVREAVADLTAGRAARWCFSEVTPGVETRTAVLTLQRPVHASCNGTFMWTQQWLTLPWWAKCDCNNRASGAHIPCSFREKSVTHRLFSRQSSPPSSVFSLCRPCFLRTRVFVELRPRLSYFTCLLFLHILHSRVSAGRVWLDDSHPFSGYLEYCRRAWWQVHRATIPGFATLEWTHWYEDEKAG